MGQSHSLNTTFRPVPLAASKNLSPSDLLTLRKRQILATTSPNPGIPASLVTTRLAGQIRLVTPAISGGMGRSVPDVQSDPNYKSDYSDKQLYCQYDIVHYEGNYFMCLIDNTQGNAPVGQYVEQYRNPADPFYSVSQAWWSLITTNRVALGTTPCCSS